MKIHPLVLAAFLASDLSVQANVSLPSIFGDHMVLQQDQKIPVWGWADPGEQISVNYAGQNVKTIAGKDGKWRTDLASIPTSSASGTLTVTGKNTLKFEDVLVGDVWVASGQSNMEFELGHSHLAKEDLPNANHPEIRLFRIPRTNRIEVQTNVMAKWEICTPQTVAGFSAVAYYFACDLQQNLKRPIGLIGTYWGGTPAQAWTGIEGLKQDTSLSSYVQEADKNLKNYLAVKDAYPKQLTDYAVLKKKWDAEVGSSYASVLQAWKASANVAKTSGQPVPPQPQPSQPEPKAPSDPNLNANQSTATVLFNGMVAPIIPYAIKGVIWYQGESNTPNAYQYRKLFPAMITDWRQKWNQGNFPFLFVQLASLSNPKPNEDYPMLRESQLKTLALPKTGMASAIDIGAGPDIHPKDKKDVGQRLALVALNVAYGRSNEFSGPLFESMKIRGHEMNLTFSHAEGGLVVGTAPWSYKGTPTPSTELKGFTLAGTDGHWVDATAHIDGSTVVISSPQVSTPVAARYAWASDPICNLYNKEGLPASPFRTDDAPPATSGK